MRQKIYWIILMLIVSAFSYCKRNNSKIDPEILFGEKNKLWIFIKKNDSLTPPESYDLICKDGKMKSFWRDNRTGLFNRVTNRVAFDLVISNDSTWNLKEDTLSLLVYKYKILGISRRADTITLKEIKNNRYTYTKEDTMFLVGPFNKKEDTLYLIDTKIL